MKNLGYIAAIALLNTAFAADLDIQKGQWSAEIDEINFNFGTGGSKKTYSDVDGDFSKDEAKLLLDFAIESRKRVKDQLRKMDETFNDEVVHFSYTDSEGKEYPPDSTSMIFWLKNRNPKQWRDKVDHDLNINKYHEMDSDTLDKKIAELLAEKDK